MADGGERPEQVKVQYRRMRFDFERTGFSRYWHGGSPFKSFFWDALSTAFPPGEKFFIDSARGVRDQIDDPELLEEIAEFCRQEGHHTYHHRKFNQMVGEQGFDVARYERRFARVLGRARRRLGPMGMLSVTMALEHFTAGFAHRYLSDPHLAEGADPNVRALWAWHAAEEAEHKSTCFDIYQRLGGEHRLRVAVMPAAWLLLVLITLRSTFSMLRADGQLWNLPDIARGFWYLFGFRGLVTRMVPSFFAYFRRDYTPWQLDDSALIERWQRDNARYIEAVAEAA